MGKVKRKLFGVIVTFVVFLAAAFFSLTLPTTQKAMAATGDIVYLAPVYGTDGNVTFDGDGNVVMEEKTLAEGTYNVVSSTTMVMGTTDTTATADENGEYWYVLNANVTVSTRIVVSGKVHLILCDGFKLQDSMGIQVSEENEFTVYGQLLNTGTLSSPANTSKDGAGIGGDTSTPNAGKITINGGTITATGMLNSGAGIGGGNGGNGGTIVINGGNVTAKGGTYYGAGIGGSGGGSGGNITINGGVVVANAGSRSAAIGGSHSGSLHGSSGNITINGGVVTANPHSGGYSCGIGASSNGKLDSITINGGIITASGYTAAAIGTAEYTGTENGTIVINGGKVTATIANGYVPAIGNAQAGTVDVTITDGYVEATGGIAAAGIGGGKNVNSGQITISGGTVIARAGTCTTGSHFSAAGIGGGGSTSSNKAGGIGYVTITGGYVEAYGSGNSAYSNVGGAGIGGGRMNHGVISISGGCIIAEGGPDADGIGGGAGRNVDTQLGQVEFTGGLGGSSEDSSGGSSGTTTPDIGSEPEDSQIQSSGAIIFATSIPDMSEEAIANYTGIICIKYGSTLAYSPSEYVFAEDFTIPANYALEIDNGDNLTITGGATLTVNGAVINNGTLTLNKGATVTGDGALISTKADNAFKGWYTDEGLTLPFDSFDTPVEQDTTLYPKFEEGAAVVNVDIQGVTPVTSVAFADTFGKTTYKGTPMAYATDEFGERFVDLEYDAKYFLLTLNEDNEIIARTLISQSERWFPGMYETVITAIDNENDGFDYQGQLSWQTEITKNSIRITPLNQIYGQDGSISDNLFNVGSGTYGGIHRNSITTATLYEQDGIIYSCDAKVVTSDGLDITKYYDITYNTGTVTSATASEIQASESSMTVIIYPTSVYVPYSGLKRDVVVQLSAQVNSKFVYLNGNDYAISITTTGLKGIYVQDNCIVITPEFSQNTSDSTTSYQKSVSYTVTYTNGEFSKTLTKSITVNWESSAETKLNIYKNGEEITGDRLDITSGATATYTAKALDQYGYEMTGKTITWSVSEDAGVSLTDGVLTVASSAQSRTVIVTATSGTKTFALPVDLIGNECIHDSNDYGYCSYCQVKIAGATVTVGEDLTMTYSVSILDEDLLANISKIAMQFTVNGETVTVYAGATKNGYYTFAYEGIAPQHMSDLIDAQLVLIDGESVTVIAEKLGYSVKQNAQNLLNKSLSAELQRLLTDMLYYGAEAQEYRGYNVDDLATDGVVGMASVSVVSADGTDLVLGEKQSETAYFKSASVWFDNVNKLYVKIGGTADVSTLSVTVNGAEAEIIEGVVYTQGILATGFDSVYTFELYENGVLVHSVAYSVKSYVNAKQDDGNAMAELASALYTYGKSAAAYAATLRN